MSVGSPEQKAAFEFLRRKWMTQELFTKKEFQAATGYGDVSFRTYWAKQFKGLLVTVGEDLYRVSLAFRQFATWPKFRDNVVTQNRILTREYDRSSYENVVMFEFFMPLRNEEYLRTALDALFYKDSIKLRLNTITSTEFYECFPMRKEEKSEAHLERVCEWIGEKFVGYSISHVSGRFRADILKTRQQALEDATNNAERYLVDETTAVVRFIFPCKAEPAAVWNNVSGSSIDERQEILRQEARLIRWVFDKLFVQSILEVVNGEDEVWLLESGMRSQLHIFRVRD
jgi:hypothetical protein